MDSEWGAMERESPGHSAGSSNCPTFLAVHQGHLDGDMGHREERGSEGPVRGLAGVCWIGVCWVARAEGWMHEPKPRAGAWPRDGAHSMRSTGWLPWYVVPPTHNVNIDMRGAYLLTGHLISIPLLSPSIDSLRSCAIQVVNLPNTAFQIAYDLSPFYR